MASLGNYLDDLRSRGRLTFTKAEALSALGQSSQVFLAAAERLIKKHRLASPKHAFYIILRPEDRTDRRAGTGAMDRPLMAHLGVDYRISLLACRRPPRLVPSGCHGVSGDRPQADSAHRHRTTQCSVRLSDGTRVRRHQPRQWLDTLKTDAGYAQDRQHRTDLARLRSLLPQSVRHQRPRPDR